MVFGEPQLFERFRAGDEQALETVYWACLDYVTRIADAVLRACATGSARGPGEMAAALADVVQEVFLKAFAPEARRRFDASRPYEPYLAQITRNVVVDYWRQMRRYVPSDLDQLIERLSLDADASKDTEQQPLVGRRDGRPGSALHRVARPGEQPRSPSAVRQRVVPARSGGDRSVSADR